jgi:WD40 repeat protein
MSRQLRCPNGHQWSAAKPTDTVCPQCGATAAEPAPTLAWSRLDTGEASTTPPERPPPTIAGFEILEEVGRGGMGVVFKARQLDRDRIVALKIILKERLDHPDAVARFRREAQAAARLAHPNIVSVFESDQDGDLHYLAMEYVPGVTLQRLVEKNGPLPVAQACDFVRQTALGLQHAVEQSLVHRDIKPANIMAVVPPGKPLPARPLIKVLDMGVARLYRPRLGEESLTTLTRDGAVLGTPDFVAPEQLEDPHGADIRADLYSLGCTFYFLLSGRVPFPGGTLVQKLDRQRWETPPSVDQLRRDVPAAVAAVVRRLMAKHPDDRYRTPGELAAALDELARTGALPRGHEPAPLRETARLTSHAGPVQAVACLENGTIVSGGADHCLRCWDPTTEREHPHFGETPYEIACIAVSGGLVLAGQGASVRVWEAATGREVHRLVGHSDAVRGVSVSADGRFVLTGGDDRTVRLWDLHGGREIQRWTGHKARVTGVALAPDGRQALSAGQDGMLRLWDTGGGRPVRDFAAPRGAVLAVVFAGEALAASGHFDTTLRLWEVDTGRELRRFSGHKQMVAAVAVTPDGSRLASGSHDHTARIWDPDSGAELWSCQGHAGPVTAVAFSADGSRLVTGSFDGTVRLWPLPHGSE